MNSLNLSLKDQIQAIREMLNIKRKSSVFILMVFLFGGGVTFYGQIPMNGSVVVYKQPIQGDDAFLNTFIILRGSNERSDVSFAFGLKGEEKVLGVTKSLHAIKETSGNAYESVRLDIPKETAVILSVISDEDRYSSPSVLGYNLNKDGSLFKAIYWIFWHKLANDLWGIIVAVTTAAAILALMPKRKPEKEDTQ